MSAIWRVGASLSLAWLCCGFTGCAATMAMHQPDAKNLSVLQPGTPRGMVVSELGPPLTSYPNAEGGVDVFNFTQGYSRVNRTARAMGHAAGTVVTGGVWEIAGIPLESWYSGTDVKLEVLYDLHGRVAGVQVFDGAEVFQGRILAEHVHLAGAGPPPYSAPPPGYAISPELGAATGPLLVPPAQQATPPSNLPVFDEQPPISGTPASYGPASS